jgi:hypothetical protein
MDAVTIINSYRPAAELTSIPDVTSAFGGFDWAPLRPEKYGDQKIEFLFISVGYALTIWEEMDARLGMLHRFMQGQSLGTEPKSYFSSVDRAGKKRDHSLNEKLASLGEIARNLKLETQFLIAIDELGKNLRAASKRRNEIGHGVVRHVSFTRDNISVYDGHYLVSKEEFMAPPGELEQLLTAKQIAVMGNRFRDLRGCWMT